MLHLDLVKIGGVVWFGFVLAASPAWPQPMPTPFPKARGFAEVVVAGFAGPQGVVYNLILSAGGSANVEPADDKVAQTLFMDANDDIVVVDFSGADALSFAFETFTGPAWPEKYNQVVGYNKCDAIVSV